ncbi:hypothetical protein ACH5RR_037417 [Cinchona calisaya]|uniref:Uncharacterized protein n=1 Tax=Cinchona calisaya TaxID=153742 RepID=A0ABD2YBL8_9GENT
MIWLSHWKFGNHLEASDKVCVSIIADSGFRVKECGFNIVFEQEQNIARPSGLCSTDMDFSAFHAVNEEVFFMCDQSLSAVYDSSSAAWSKYLLGDSDESLDLSRLPAAVIEEAVVSSYAGQGQRNAGAASSMTVPTPDLATITLRSSGTTR